MVMHELQVITYDQKHKALCQGATNIEDVCKK